MTRQELFEIWAPPQSPWSRWAKPVLFAEMPPPGAAARAEELLLPPVTLPTEAHTVLVVDLPGVESLRTGLALAHAGCRPVPLYNSAPAPAGVAAGPTALVETAPLMQWLARGAVSLGSLRLPAEAPPAFLLDAQRQSGQSNPLPGRFDNRWLVFPQDFPSAGFLRRQGMTRVVLWQTSGRAQPAADLAHVLLRWQAAGLPVLRFDPAIGPEPGPLQVARPSQFGALWYRALALMGLRRNSAGGFGAVIPQPSSGG
jgi:hypothetical protein